MDGSLRERAVTDASHGAGVCTTGVRIYNAAVLARSAAVADERIHTISE